MSPYKQEDVLLKAVLGRKPEKRLLNTIYSSKAAELVVIYGRR
jgi:hypothetical protein